MIILKNVEQYPNFPQFAKFHSYFDYRKERNVMARKYSIMNILSLIVKTPNKFPILL